jgi:hypothetical protein
MQHRLSPILLCAAAFTIGMAAEVPGQLTLETERVVVFKDGHGLFVKRATGSADDEGRVFTDEVPVSAVLGTFWALSQDDRPLLSMTAGWVETVERRSHESSCTSVQELLRVNAGKRVSLELETDRRIEGRLVEVLELSPERGPGPTVVTIPALSSVAGVDIEDRAEETVRQIEPRGGDLVVLESRDHGRVVLPVASVRSVSGPELTTRMVREEEVTRRTKRLVFDLGADAANRPVSLRILYFSPGIRWIPAYRLEGDFEGSAALSLQGEILNEAEDIDRAALDLVVGVPNFRFKDVVSPFVLEATLVNALRRAAPDIMGQRMSNTFTQRASEWRAETPPEPRPGGVMDLAPQLAAGGGQDLFVYSRRDISLAKGERSAMALWRREVPVGHIYTLDVTLVRNPRTGSTRSSGRQEPQALDPSPLRLSPHQVWHQLELVNDGDAPWTTGPVLLLRDDLPLGQELLTYTSPGAGTLVPVTVAVDVRGNHDETEVERQLNALRHNGHSYTLVRKEGTIRLANFRDEPVTIRATVSFGGKAESVSDGGDIVLDDFKGGDWEERSTALNNHSTVSWKIEVSPGDTATLTYTCSFYLP